MIGPGDSIVIGAPGPLAFWAFEALKALARQSDAAVSAISVDRLEALAARAAAVPRRLLLCHFPTAQMIEALATRTDVPVLYLDEPPRLVAAYLVAGTGRTPIEAVRVCTASYVASLVLRRNPRVLILTRDDTRPVAELLSSLCAHVGIAVQADALARYASHIAPEDRSKVPLDASIRRFLPNVAQPDDLDPAVLHVLIPMVDSVLEPTRGLVSDDALRPIEWPIDVFYSAAQPKETAEHIVDLTGPARMLFHGPYFHLPPARYDVEVTIACRGIDPEASFRIELHGGDKLLARVRLNPGQSGGYQGRFAAGVTNPVPEVQLQTIAERGAIFGEFALLRCRLFPQVVD